MYVNNFEEISGIRFPVNTPTPVRIPPLNSPVVVLYVSDEQTGFRQGRGQETKSRISEYRCTRHGNTSNHSMCLVDFKKAFDSVKCGT